jgi:hypothetical protein
LEGDENDRPILFNEGIPIDNMFTLETMKQESVTMSNLIIHQNNNTGAIISLSECNDKIILNNILIEDMNLNYVYEVFSVYNISYLEMNNVFVRNVSNYESVGPYCLNSNLTMRNCVFENNRSTGTGDMMGYPCLYINIRDSLLLENCKFTNNITNTDWGSILAIGPEQFTNPKVTLKNVECTYNLTSDRTIFMGCPTEYEAEEEKQILNCTIAYNTAYPYTAEIIGKTRITNSIFHNFNTYEILLPDLHAYDIYSDLTVEHSLIQGGENGIVNENGVNTINWLEGNITFAPGFVGEGDNPFALSDTSPCIDAGTLDLPEGVTLPETDLAGNRRVVGNNIDMGAYEYQGTEANDITLPEIENTLLSVYPNPFVLSEAGTKSTVRIKLELSQDGEIDLSIYNMKGQKVKQLIGGKSSKGIFTANWDLKDKNGKKVSSGIYFVKLSQNKKLTRVSKLTVIK